jgi:hypothetical protein
MPKSSVRVVQQFPSTQIQPKPKPAAQAEAMSPLENLQQRFDDAFDRADELGALIQARQSRGSDCSALLEKLKEAEADKRSALAALRKVRWMMTNRSF